MNEPVVKKKIEGVPCPECTLGRVTADNAEQDWQPDESATCSSCATQFTIIGKNQIRYAKLL